MKMMDFVKFYNNIKVDDYVDKTTSLAYHYTSPDGLSGIINNQTLRFTDRFYLNDKSEGVYVLNLCLENINHFDFLDDTFRNVFVAKCEERLKNPQRDRFYVYQCSLSTEKDSLCLWNYYTKADGIKGYNIEIDLNNISENIVLNPYDKERVPKLRFGKIIYDTDQQKEILKELVKKFYEYNKTDAISGEHFVCEYLVDKIMYLGVFFKMDCFKAESEFRLVYDLFLNEDGTYAVIKDEQKFYEKNGIFIPYIDIKFRENIITGIGISPTLDYEATKESVLRMTARNYSKIKNDTIYESKIPVRY